MNFKIDIKEVLETKMLIGHPLRAFQTYWRDRESNRYCQRNNNIQGKIEQKDHLGKGIMRGTLETACKYSEGCSKDRGYYLSSSFMRVRQEVKGFKMQ